MAGESIGIVWFRRDLRLADNPVLARAAADHDRVVALWVHDDRLRRPSGANRVAFLTGCLDALDESIGGHLVRRVGDPSGVVPEVAAEVEAPAVYCAEDFGPYGRARDAAVEAALARDGRRLVRVGTPYAVAPGSLRTKAGEPFKVFTPFSRSWRAHGWDAPTDEPTRVHWVTEVRGNPRPATPDPEADELPSPGERAAHDCLERFVHGPVDDYAEARDLPGTEGTSRLSPHLKFGTLHPRQVLDRLGSGRGPDTFATELCWREFYADVLFHRPDSAHRSLQPRMAAMEVDDGADADRRFDAWCRGRTGVPIVDAGMRQLLAEGWMHNRVRMIAASFLVKDLHLDWTRGARWFLRHLVDGDLASNQHGWQWVAGTGTDAAPYFRVFNPVRQSERFDPEGRYLRRWLPELRGVEGGAVHEPWTIDRSLFSPPGLDDYPAPLVDHAEERDEALRRFRALPEG